MERNRLIILIIFVVSLSSTLGSLYFSEVRGYIPCEMCWYSRILMYSTVIISLVGGIKNDINIILYIRVMSILGIILSLYHYSLQKIRVLGNSASFCGDVGCNIQYINWFYFITIPFLALIGYITIFVITLIKNKKECVKND